MNHWYVLSLVSKHMEFSDYAFADFWIYYTVIREWGLYDISSEISSVAYHILNLGGDFVCILKEYKSLFVE